VGAILMPFFADPVVIYGHRCLKSTQVALKFFFIIEKRK
jgi:hypothetical protein